MMRWLLGILLLVNLGLFLWIQTRMVQPEIQISEDMRPPGVQNILLVREIAQQPSADAQPEPQQPPNSVEETSPMPEPDEIIEPGISEAIQEDSVTALPDDSNEQPEESLPNWVCGRIGPYTDKSEAEKTSEELNKFKAEVSLEQTKEQIQTGYWVLISALPSRKEARQKVKDLKAAGVTDLWLFTKGSMKNSISLGMYVGIKNATSHSNNINKKGFKSQVSPKLSQQTGYWLNYRTMDGQFLANVPAELTNEKKACE